MPGEGGFGRWIKWERRVRLSHDWDVRRDFDHAGLYLLGRFEGTDQALQSEATHLHPDVIYMGMSKALIRRSEWHEKVARYRLLFPGELGSLFHATWHFNTWSSWNLDRTPAGKVKRVTLAAEEGRLISEYANTFGRLPLLQE